MADVPVFKPTAFYRDPISALRWLEAAFGFETTVLVTDADGQVGYSEMSFGNGAVSINASDAGSLNAQRRLPSCGTITASDPARLMNGVPDVPAASSTARLVGVTVGPITRSTFSSVTSF